MNQKIKEIENELVRDICSVSVAPAAKSEVRKLVGIAIQEVIDETKTQLKEEFREKLGIICQMVGDQEMWSKRDILEEIKKAISRLNDELPNKE